MVLMLLKDPKPLMFYLICMKLKTIELAPPGKIHQLLPVVIKIHKCTVQEVLESLDKLKEIILMLQYKRIINLRIIQIIVIQMMINLVKIKKVRMK